jgi:hypothetical protein
MQHPRGQQLEECCWDGIQCRSSSTPVNHTSHGTLAHPLSAYTYLATPFHTLERGFAVGWYSLILDAYARCAG